MLSPAITADSQLKTNKQQKKTPCTVQTRELPDQSPAAGVWAAFGGSATPISLIILAFSHYLSNTDSMPGDGNSRCKGPGVEELGVVGHQPERAVGEGRREAPCDRWDREWENAAGPSPRAPWALFGAQGTFGVGEWLGFSAYGLRGRVWFLRQLSWKAPSDRELLARPTQDPDVQPQPQAQGLAHGRACLIKVSPRTAKAPVGLDVFSRLFGEQDVAGLEKTKPLRGRKPRAPLPGDTASFIHSSVHPCIHSLVHASAGPNVCRVPAQAPLKPEGAGCGGRTTGTLLQHPHSLQTPGGILVSLVAAEPWSAHLG